MWLQGVRQVLVKLGAKGSALFVGGEEPIRQSIIPAAKVVDTTGAGDTFTAAFAVALVEGKSKKECLQFAGTNTLSGTSPYLYLLFIYFSSQISRNSDTDVCFDFIAAAASLCVQVKGAIPSMPERNAVEELLESLWEEDIMQIYGLWREINIEFCSGNKNVFVAAAV